MNLNPFFHAKTIAIIGASREPGKIGNTILKQLMGKTFTLYPVNPNADTILGITSYKKITDISGPIDLAIIAIPGSAVPSTLYECAKKNIQHAVIISAGFKEVGNTTLDEELHDALIKTNILAIGPNCLGIYDAHTGMDTFFLPKERLERPKKGGISFISQSGATCSAIMDLAAYENFGFSKVISYGNAANVTETDLLSYLSQDPQTTVICMYVEGITDGKRFLEIAKHCKKPIIAIKAGTTKEGKQAAKSHTGSLAGTSEIYFGAFTQAGIITAHTLEDIFDYARIFDKLHIRPKGNRVHIVTNGGGYGILSADAVVHNKLTLAQPGKKLALLKNKFPPTVVLHNPCDVLGDATNERYKLVLSAILQDNTADSILLVLLTQTPLINEQLLKIIHDLNSTSDKPIVVVITGSDYSHQLRRTLEHYGLPVYTFPENAVKALAAYTHYYLHKKL